jgi:hypothetical protein
VPRREEGAVGGERRGDVSALQPAVGAGHDRRKTIDRSRSDLALLRITHGHDPEARRAK